MKKIKKLSRQTAKKKRSVVVKKLDKEVDNYWLSKTPAERIAAMEILRQHWYKIHNELPTRLRRVVRITKLREG